MVRFFYLKTEKCKAGAFLYYLLCVLGLLQLSCSSPNTNSSSPEVYTQLGEKIRTERIKKGLSQEQLAEAIGMSLKNLKLVEEGLATPVEAKIQAMEEYLGVPLVHFINEPKLQHNQ